MDLFWCYSLCVLFINVNCFLVIYIFILLFVFIVCYNENIDGYKNVYRVYYLFFNEESDYNFNLKLI